MLGQPVSGPASRPPGLACGQRSCVMPGYDSSALRRRPPLMEQALLGNAVRAATGPVTDPSAPVRWRALADYSAPQVGVPFNVRADVFVAADLQHDTGSTTPAAVLRPDESGHCAPRTRWHES